jgi:DNA-binding NarL/FixJ family response regulator
MKPIRVLIVDDHALVRRGIQAYLDTDPSIQIVGEAAAGLEAVHQAKRLKPDVILMDLMLPDEDGIQATAAIKRSNPAIKILVLTSFGDEPRVKAAIQAGADGYLLKDADGEALLAAIYAVLRGDLPIHPHVTRYLVGSAGDSKGVRGSLSLTEREKEVLQLVVKGLSNSAIGHALGISPSTAKGHVSRVFAKLNVASRTEAAVQAMKLGLAPPDEPDPYA